MCIIVDNCVTGDYLSKKDYLAPIGKYIGNGGKIAISAKLYKEYPSAFQNILVEMGKSGRIKKFTDVPLPAAIEEVVVSNDSHIVGLVRISGTRVVCTTDHALIRDLKNVAIINNPRCKIYQRKAAHSILNGCCT